MDGSVLEEQSYFKMLGLTFSSKLDLGSYIISIAKTVSKKIGTFLSFILLRLLCVSINLPFTHVWNTIVAFGLLLQVATWIVREATKTNMQDSWSFTCCFS